MNHGGVIGSQDTDKLSRLTRASAAMSEETEILGNTSMVDDLSAVVITDHTSESVKSKTRGAVKGVIKSLPSPIKTCCLRSCFRQLPCPPVLKHA